MSESEAPAADWYTDPSGRFEYRYWDGSEWTGHVSTDGKTDWDPPGEAAPEGAEASDAAPTAEQGAADQVAADQGAAEHDAAGHAEVQAEPADHDASAASEDDHTAFADQSESSDEVPADDGLPADHNLAANLRADVDADVREWLDQVAGQVGPRLSRINRDWPSLPQAEAAKACAYGLLVGHLAKIHPHMRPELSNVAERHESFSTLEDGKRLDTLSDIAADSERTASWLGPLIGVSDADEVSQLFD